MTQGASQAALGGVLQLVSMMNQQREMRDRLLTSFADKAATVPYADMLPSLAKFYDQQLGGGYMDQLTSMGKSIHQTASAEFERIAGEGLRDRPADERATLGREFAFGKLAGRTPEAVMVGRETERIAESVNPSPEATANLGMEFWSRQIGGGSRAQLAQSRSVADFLGHVTEGTERREQAAGMGLGFDLNAAQAEDMRLRWAVLQSQMQMDMLRIQAQQAEGMRPDPDLIAKLTDQKIRLQDMLASRAQDMEPFQREQIVHTIENVNMMLRSQNIPTERIPFEGGRPVMRGNFRGGGFWEDVGSAYDSWAGRLW